MEQDDATPRTLSTVETTCEIIEALMELEGAGVTELADYLGISKGGAYNHLATLHSREYVRKEGDEYRLSYKFFNLGEFVKHGNRLYRAGKSAIEKLASETGESTYLMVEQFGKGIYYHRVPGQEGISEEYHRNLLEGTDYLHWSATGKALLAHLDRDRAADIVDQHGLPEGTENTITDPEALLAELDRIEQQGYAQNDEEQIPGVRAVGACVHGNDGEVLGSISISGPTSRIDDRKFDDVFPDQVLQTTNVIEVSLETRDVDFNEYWR